MYLDMASTDTTKVAGKYVRTLPHITGDIINSKLQAELCIKHD